MINYTVELYVMYSFMIILKHHFLKKANLSHSHLKCNVKMVIKEDILSLSKLYQD